MENMESRFPLDSWRLCCQSSQGCKPRNFAEKVNGNNESSYNNKSCKWSIDGNNKSSIASNSSPCLLQNQKQWEHHPPPTPPAPARSKTAQAQQLAGDTPPWRRSERRCRPHPPPEVAEQEVKVAKKRLQNKRSATRGVRHCRLLRFAEPFSPGSGTISGDGDTGSRPSRK